MKRLTLYLVLCVLGLALLISCSARPSSETRDVTRNPATATPDGTMLPLDGLPARGKIQPEAGAASARGVETRRQINGATEKLIPYDDIYRYPSNWPDKSEAQRGDGSVPSRVVRNNLLPSSSKDSLLLPWEDRQDVNVSGPIAPPTAPGVRSPAPRPPLTMRAGEELWIIQRFHVVTARPDDAPGTGALAAKQMKDGKEALVPVPLKHTDVKASVAAYLSSTTVKQQFRNPFAEKIEAVYVFPLPENAAINEFVMTIGDRRIRGIIRERDEAEKIYKEARSQGYVASLLTQERPNVFTQSVANIEPGKEIDVEITYYHTLAYADGWYEWVFPMVVAPRYSPAGSTQGVAPVARGQQGSSGQKTEVQYLKPSERSGHDISLTVELDSPVSLEEIHSSSHQIEIQRRSASRACVSIAPSDTLPNKDFVLRYRVAGGQIKSGLLAHRDQRGGYLSLMIFPPAELRQSDRLPVEMVFLLDISGSMSGEPLQQSKAAMRYALAHMDAKDTFQVITFANATRSLFDVAQPVTPKNTEQAMKFVEQSDAGGGTEMVKGIAAALDAVQDPGHKRMVVFLTDGCVGNEDQILRSVHEKLGDARIFSFGVGSSVNRYLMDGLARVGQGAVAYLGLKDDGAEVMRLYFDRVSCPAMTDIQVDFGPDAHVSQLYPTRKSDLFVGRPIVLTARFTGQMPQQVRVLGTIGDRRYQLTVHTDSASQSNPALAAIWARQRIADLSDNAFYQPSQQAELTQGIRATAIEYGLMSQYTAFVAVDSTRQTQGAHGVSVAVPVPVPQGVRYDTTVPEN